MNVNQERIARLQQEMHGSVSGAYRRFSSV